MSRERILVIEDDQSLVDVLRYNLEQEDYEVRTAYDGQDGLNQALSKSPDLILLDLMLPVYDGLEVCRRLRSNPNTKSIRILMLTAKSEETDQVVGFAMGADDYVTKPFSVKVLMERVKALLRRHESETDNGSVVSSQGVTIDRQAHRVTIDDELLDLTPSEFRLLDVLIRQPGRAFSRSELMDAALGEDTIVLERTIDVHIRALRHKLGSHASLVETVRGVGYRFKSAKYE